MTANAARKRVGAPAFAAAEFSRVVAKHRRERELTVREAAAEAEVSINTFSRVERGIGGPDAQTLYALCAWMRCDPADFRA